MIAPCPGENHGPRHEFKIWPWISITCEAVVVAPIKTHLQVFVGVAVTTGGTTFFGGEALEGGAFFAGGDITVGTPGFLPSACAGVMLSTKPIMTMRSASRICPHLVWVFAIARISNSFRSCQRTRNCVPLNSLSILPYFYTKSKG